MSFLLHFLSIFLCIKKGPSNIQSEVNVNQSRTWIASIYFIIKMLHSIIRYLILNLILIFICWYWMLFKFFSPPQLEHLFLEELTVRETFWEHIVTRSKWMISMMVIYEFPAMKPSNRMEKSRKKNRKNAFKLNWCIFVT